MSATNVWTSTWTTRGRPRLMKAIAAPIVRMTRENSTWGYGRIQGEQEEVGHRVASITIANVLKANGIEPLPHRASSWRTFIKAHWGQVAATDFFNAEVWTSKGLLTYYLFSFLDLETRRVHVAGITEHPTGAFPAHMARNLTIAPGPRQEIGADRFLG